MSKYNIDQPPKNEYFQLIVEDMSENEFYGWTRNIEHIDYNREIIGEWFDLDVAVKQLTSVIGNTTVFQCGLYICILKLKPDNSEGEMEFHYFERIAKQNYLDMLKKDHKYSDNVINDLIKNYDLISSSDLGFLDSVRLVLSSQLIS